MKKLPKKYFFKRNPSEDYIDKETVWPEEVVILNHTFEHLIGGELHYFSIILPEGENFIYRKLKDNSFSINKIKNGKITDSFLIAATNSVIQGSHWSILTNRGTKIYSRLKNSKKWNLEIFISEISEVLVILGIQKLMMDNFPEIYNEIQYNNIMEYFNRRGIFV